MSYIFTLKEMIQVALGIMLMVFGVISITIGDFTWIMLTPTIGFFVLGGFLTYRGIKQYLARQGVSISVDSSKLEETPTSTGGYCPECGSQVTEGTKFCTNCGYNFQ